MICGFNATVYNIDAVSVIQVLTPQAMLGRVMASFRFLVTASLVVDALIVGAASSIVGLRTIIACGSLMLLAGNYSGGPVAGSEDPIR
jgi:hypothetical protein